VPGAQCVRGGLATCSSTPQGRVTLHRDYWDAAEELYEKLPAGGRAHALAASGAESGPG
jgi:steroid delta-isomerase